MMMEMVEQGYGQGYVKPSQVNEGVFLLRKRCPWRLLHLCFVEGVASILKGSICISMPSTGGTLFWRATV